MISSRGHSLRDNPRRALSKKSVRFFDARIGIAVDTYEAVETPTRSIPLGMKY